MVLLSTSNNVLPNVTGSFERKPINNNSIKNILQKYELADTPLSSFEICDDLLIRNIYYPDIVSMKIMTLKDGLYLLGLKLGWILSGWSQSENSSAPENSMAGSINLLF